MKKNIFNKQIYNLKIIMIMYSYQTITLWLLISFCVIFFIRYNQYKIYWQNFVFRHSLLDFIILINPIVLFISPVLWINKDLSNRTLIIQTSIYIVSYIAYLILKYSYFKNNKYYDKFFPYADLSIITSCILIFSVLKIF